MDPELEELPTDMLRGLDFRIAKTQKGGFADYNSSKWARKETALTETEQAAVTAHGLFDLGTFLPKHPTDVELKVIKEMFEASVDGKAYDTERWGQYFRPAGVNAPAGSAAAGDDDTPAAKPVVANKPSPASSFEDDVVIAEAAIGASKPVGQNAQDILALIRSRQKQ